MSQPNSNTQLPPSILQEWIPRASVMQFLGYQATQMYHFLKSGKVKTVKIGKRIFVNRKSLMAYLDDRSTVAEY